MVNAFGKLLGGSGVKPIESSESVSLYLSLFPNAFTLGLSQKSFDFDMRFR